MSVCVHLWEPLDAKYLGHPYDNIKPSEFRNPDRMLEIDAELGYPSVNDPEYEVKSEAKSLEYAMASWSDGEIHDEISYCHYHILRSQKTWYDKLEQFNPQIQKQKGITMKIIPVHEIAYDQGWFFKNSFFKKEFTQIFCTTWKEVDKAWKRYFKVNKYTCKMYERFRKCWKDGMIFEISF